MPHRTGHATRVLLMAALVASACSVTSPPVSGPTATPAPAGATTTPSPIAPTASASSTPFPSPLPCTPDGGQVTIRGDVFDIYGNRLDGVTVTARMSGSVAFPCTQPPDVDPFVRTVVTRNGSYEIPPVYGGNTVQITVSKAGYGVRQAQIVPLANLTGDPLANRLDFGGKNPDLALVPNP